MRRIFKFKSFSIGFGIFIFFTLVAIPGYLITPDKSENCNDIIPQISNQSPGFQCTFIRIKNQNTSKKTGFFQTWLFGQEPNGTAIPIQPTFIKSKDSITVYSLFNTDTLTYALQHLAVEDGSVSFSRKFYLGTDRFGRDVLSRLIVGARVSLMVGLISVIICLFIGTFIGMIGGYLGGITDTFVSWLIAVFWNIPTLLIALGLSFVFGKGLAQVLLAVGLSTWVEVARVVRGQTMQLREKEFILAAKITGFSTLHILRKHILPNMKGSLTVLATTNFASAILLEAGLSFLGLGIAPPAPSWGIMVKEHLGNLVLDSAYLAIIPGAAIMLLVMAFNFMSMGLRDAFDTRININ